MAASLSLPPWAVGPEELLSQPKSKVFDILDSALTIAALRWPGELSARQHHILHNLDKAFQQHQPCTRNNNIMITVDLRPSPKTTNVDDYNDAASSYKWKLEKGYAANEEARKRSKVKAKKKEAVEEEKDQFLLPRATIAAATPSKKSPSPPAPVVTKATFTAARGKKKPPRWWMRLKNERNAARIRSLVHLEIQQEQQQQRHSSQLSI